MDLVSQRAETEDVFRSLSEQVGIPPKILLNLQFVPLRDDSGRKQLLDEAMSVGYEAEWIPDDDDDVSGYAEFSVVVMQPNADLIWEHEKRLTILADRFGFGPDGWGFMVPMD